MIRWLSRIDPIDAIVITLWTVSFLLALVDGAGERAFLCGCLVYSWVHIANLGVRLKAQRRTGGYR